MPRHIVLALAVGAAFASAWTFGARAHTAPAGWNYDASCCNGDNMSGDCQEIPDSAVKVVADGYEITLVPGQHRLVTTTHVWERKSNEARQSPDGRYHACLWPDETTLRCFYAPPFGS